MTHTFTLGAAIPVPDDDMRDIRAGLDDIEAADFLVMTGPTGEGAGVAPNAALGFLAPRTTIGLVAESDVGYAEPFPVARTLATLDHVSGGRAAWQLTVDTSRAAARRRGLPAPLPPAELTARVVEFTCVVRDLWDSWDSDAVVTDRARGIFVRSDRVHHLHHAGRYFSVRGPATLPRSPQGRPPTFVRLNGDAHSHRLAGAVGEVVRLRATSADQVGAARAEYPAARVLVDIPFTTVSGTLALAAEMSRVAQGIVIELSTSDLDGGPLRAVADHLAGRGLRGHVPRRGTFRERLGLPAPISRFAPEDLA